MTGDTEQRTNGAGGQELAETWAVCCSGGGIRSASYCLGALQRLEEEDLLGSVQLITGVSGGSYIASSRALVAHGLGQDAGPPPYAPGTPEEQHLRNNTRYLVPNAATLLAGVLSLLFGVAVTLVLALTPLFALAHVWGWVLRSQGVLAPPAAAHSGAQHWTATLTGITWLIGPAIAAGVTFIIFLWWWVTLVPTRRGRERHSDVAVRALGWAALVTLVLAVALLAVPELIAWLSGAHAGALGTVLRDLGFGSGAAFTPGALAGLAAAIVAVSQSAQRSLTKYNLLKAPASGQAPAAKPTGLAAVSVRVRALLLPWLASVLILLAGVVAGLRWAKDGAAAGFTADQVWVVVGAVVVMLVVRALVDANRISLHDFYRWRLGTAYAVTRKPGPADGGRAQFGVNRCPGTRLSELTGDGDRPPLVICTTANISADRKAHSGRGGGMSLTFDPEHATLRGPGEPVQARTEDYETLVGKRRFTLLDVSAISGAAFSPLMGAATRQAHRILFTVTDLRLGVWLPHPAIVDAASRELARQDNEGKDRWWTGLWLLMWYVLPHFGWQDTGGREARLWAHVLRLRRSTGGFQRFLGRLLYQSLQPTLGMLYAEAAGHTSYRCTWMCVTDGGHYDNLGLVEALQRSAELGVTHILVLDASGDKTDTFSTLGGSIRLARSDAATKITLNPAAMVRPLPPGMPALEHGQVLRPWASGTFTTPGQPGTPEKTILVCKLGWWTGAPWDVRAYAEGHPDYPTDPTINQLYDSAEFDAYRELGSSAVGLAIADHQLATDAGAEPGLQLSADTGAEPEPRPAPELPGQAA